MVSNLTVKIGADIDGLRNELNKATGQLQGFGKGMKKIGGMVAGAFAVGGMISFGKEVFNVTAQFQKFEAVLTNTLGHNGAANAALAQITEFAAKTPYAVNELTSSFVKLANQGFVPTLKQMQSLGDLASAMGKSFDQLTEAIIDAQTGEFERLKEFGIRASKQGDKVTFTFKGVKKQVDFTADSIRQYVLSLGDVTGVTGGMEAQSKTLGGGLSNLADSWEQLTLAIGKAAESGGLFSKTLDLIAAGVKGLKGLFEVGESKEELLATIRFFQEARSLAARNGDQDSWRRANEALQAATEKLRNLVEGEKKLAEIQNNSATPATKAQTEAVRDLWMEWAKLHSIFKDKPFSPTDGIAKKTGSDFGFDSGAMTDTLEAFNRIHNALMSVNGDLKVNSQEWAIWEGGIKARMQMLAEKTEMDFSPVIHSALSGIGQALGNAMNGTASLGDALLRVFGGVLTQLGEMLIATGVGIASFKKALSSLNPAVAIGAGIALVAMGTAIAGSIKGLGDASGSASRSVGSSGGGGGNSRGSLGNSGLEITLGGSWEISGDKLVYIFNRTQQKNSRTRG